MTEHPAPSVLLLADERELSPSQRIWGTGGWLPPEQREALDWLTLSRLLGWDVTVAWRPVVETRQPLPSETAWIIIGYDPDHVSTELANWLSAALHTQRLFVVARAGSPDSPFGRLAGVARQTECVSGRRVCWTGPDGERNWNYRHPLNGVRLDVANDASIWARMDDAPLIAARRVGRGIIATLGFHPSAARDAAGSATALLKHLLINGAPQSVTWPDFTGTVILRMDDPGGAQNVYFRNWSYSKLNQTQWRAIGDDLRRRNASVSLGYVAGWVDDGDACRGELLINGASPPRMPGRVYPTPQVKYRDRAGHAPGTVHDYADEHQGIQALRAEGLADVELHGFTHMHPDHEAWAQAPDRYEAQRWFRELGRAAQAAIAACPAHAHPLALGVAALREYFHTRPTTLISPGDQWTNEVLEFALDLGLRLVSSYYLAIRHQDRFCWTTHVCAPYLDQPDPAWFDSELPVVGYFHDYEISREGVAWLTHWLDAWRKVGAARFINFRQFTTKLYRDGALL